MVIQAVNQRAKERYLSFLAAMAMVEDRFSDLDRLIRQVPVKGNQWRAARVELTGMRQTAYDRLMVLREIAKRYESELLSREWRV